MDLWYNRSHVYLCLCRLLPWFDAFSTRLDSPRLVSTRLVALSACVVPQSTSTLPPSPPTPRIPTCLSLRSSHRTQYQHRAHLNGITQKAKPLHFLFSKLRVTINGMWTTHLLLNIFEKRNVANSATAVERLALAFFVIINQVATLCGAHSGSIGDP